MLTPWLTFRILLDSSLSHALSARIERWKAAGSRMTMTLNVNNDELT
jgi:hypothetical protein